MAFRRVGLAGIEVRAPQRVEEIALRCQVPAQLRGEVAQGLQFRQVPRPGPAQDQDLEAVDRGLEGIARPGSR